MGEWKEYRLGDAPVTIIDGDRGANYPKHNEFTSTGYCLFLSTKNVRENGFLFSECQFISKEKDLILRKGKLERYDLVLTTRGTIGNVGYYGDSVPYDNIRINSGMVIIRPDRTKMIPEFCFYIFRCLQRNFIEHVSGSAQPQLPIKDLNEITIKLPPIEKQKEIAEILSSLDAKIDLLNNQNATLEQMAETLFRHHFIDNAQADWVEKKLVDVCHFAVKKIPVADVNIETYISTENMLVDKKGITNATSIPTTGKATQYVEGDILFSNIRTYFKKIWFANRSGACSNDVLCFSVVNDKISNEYLYYALRQDDFFEYVTLGSKGCKMPRGDKDHIMNYTIVVPNEEVMTNFTIFANSILSKTNKNSIQIKSLKKMRDMLLSKLMSNEIKLWKMY